MATCEGLIQATKEPPVTNQAQPAIASPPTTPASQPRVPAPHIAVAGHAGTRVWQLGPDAPMSVGLPPVALTKKHIEKIKKYVAALEMEASVNWDDDDGG